MEETDKIDPKQLKGFNDGYLIAKYEPELSEKLSKIEAVSLWVKGMQQGREQYLKEQIKDKQPNLPNWLTGNRSSTEKQISDKSKDKGIEPEK